MEKEILFTEGLSVSHVRVHMSRFIVGEITGNSGITS